MKSLSLRVLVLILLWCCFVQGATLQETVQNEALPFSIGLGGSYHSFDYREVLPAPKKSNETGNLAGINLAFAWEAPTKNWFLLGAFAYSSGTLKYEGSVSAPGGSFKGYAQGNGEHSLYTAEVNPGYTFLGKTSGTRLQGYTGLGYRYWNRGGTGQQGDYSEQYSWWYMPIGGRAILSVFENLEIGLDAALVLNLGGDIDIKLSESNSNLGDVTSSLGTALGYRIRLPIRARLSKNIPFRISVIPWYERSSIGEGDFVPMVDSTGNPVRIRDPRNGDSQFIVVQEPASDNDLFGISSFVEFLF